MGEEYFDTIECSVDPAELFGIRDVFIGLIEDAFGVSVLFRNGLIRVGGESENVKKALLAISRMQQMIKNSQSLDEQMVSYIARRTNEGLDVSALSAPAICYTFRGKPIRAKTEGQRRYVESIRKNEIIICIGPAGTGKTYLAVAMAVSAYKNGDVDRIILTRPAVEAGESLGFLPGDLKEKVDPYLRPLYDALYDIMGYETYERLTAKGIIEIAPLAYMRGRTLDNAFIILDEAQNTTAEQMKMFLTRLGFSSKAVITGDITQIDLPGGKKSGLATTQDILASVKGIGFSHLFSADVVRNPIVQRIIEAYEKYENR